MKTALSSLTTGYDGREDKSAMILYLCMEAVGDVIRLSVYTSLV